jgi:hypothetical protein
MTRDVERTVGRALTAAELIEALGAVPPEARVVFVCDYGDYCHTQQALPVRDVTDLEEEGGRLVESAYSQSGVALDRPDPDDDDEDDDPDEPDPDCPVVVLS